MTPKKSRLSPGVWTVLCLLLALCLWEWAAAAGHVNDYFFSRPSALWAEFLELVSSGLLAKHLSVTLQEAGLGLLFGGLFGTLAGLGLGLAPRVSRALTPLLTGLNGLPKLALGPVFIIWFGLGLSLSGAIVGEYLGSTKGMGWLLSAAGDVFNSTRVLCCVLVLVVLIIALDAVVHLLEWRLLRWRG